MWPEATLGRGSGSLPSNRPAPRASTTGEHGGLVDHLYACFASIEARLARLRLAAFGRPALLPPFRETAVKDGHPFGAEVAEHEPATRGGAQRTIVIDDNPVVAADAQLGHRPGEITRRWQHVRGRVISVGDFRNVEETGAGNMGVEELRRRIAPVRGKEGAAIDDCDVGRIEVARQPLGRHQVIHMRLLAAG